MDTPVRQQRQILALERELRKDRTVETPRRPINFAARYDTAVAQSIPNNTITIVNYGTLVYDDGACVTTGAAWSYLCRSDGIYSVKASILYTTTTTWAAGEEASLYLYRNGTLYSSLHRRDDMLTAATFVHLQGSDDIELAAGDTINIRTRQISGAALALWIDRIFNRVAIAKIA